MSPVYEIPIIADTRQQAEKAVFAAGLTILDPRTLEAITGPAKPAKPKAKPKRCEWCAAKTGHFPGCARNHYKLPKLTQPKPGTAAHAKLAGKIQQALAECARNVDPRTGHLKTSGWKCPA